MVHAYDFGALQKKAKGPNLISTSMGGWLLHLESGTRERERRKEMNKKKKKQKKVKSKKDYFNDIKKDRRKLLWGVFV
jgi:sugar lactone lactonase YvrE